MPVNLDKPHRWKTDIAESVETYNRWFLASAPAVFQDQRRDAAAMVGAAMAKIDATALERHPEILPSLRMATSPPLARDRLVGLANVSRSLLDAMEKRRRAPPRLGRRELRRQLDRICRILNSLIDRDLCPWIAGRTAADDDVRMAELVIADRLCGFSANPRIRNAQEERQLDRIATWLLERDYVHMSLEGLEEPASLTPGAFAFRVSVEGWLDREGESTVRIPVDVVVKPRGASNDELPIFVEAKSAGDFANVNKRRKEEAVKAAQLRRRYGPATRFVLFLGGYFDASYLGYEAAEGIDWVWEHRVDDFSELGL